jgi:hypothetical protein
MRGLVTAVWALAMWGMLLNASTALIAAVCVLTAMALKPQVIRRHAALLIGTAAFGAAVFAASVTFGVAPRESYESVLKLLAVVAVVPLASDFVDGFWICRMLTRARVSRRLTLALSSSFSALPVLVEDLQSLVYQRRIVRARSGISALVATFVMALDRVQELEIVDHSFDPTALFESAPAPRFLPGELFYAANLAAAIGWLVLAR